MKNIAFSVNSCKLGVVLEFSAHLETDEVVLSEYCVYFCL